MTSGRNPGLLRQVSSACSAASVLRRPNAHSHAARTKARFSTVTDRSVCASDGMSSALSLWPLPLPSSAVPTTAMPMADPIRWSRDQRALVDSIRIIRALFAHPLRWGSALCGMALFWAAAVYKVPKP
jgi:hypothetical protein